MKSFRLQAGEIPPPIQEERRSTSLLTLFRELPSQKLSVLLQVSPKMIHITFSMEDLHLSARQNLHRADATRSFRPRPRPLVRRSTAVF
ncbi:hypothetical protein L596_026808 [Steinernema carpocapsae]|uniref:Uncharacterized protein n=1 Tax=Steinernema carpocapsae TaxID=34508 RepID=A0A4U5M2G4_STECR|nr:hypothetical protein L596_026808 [Steinernema carpocapsae]